MKPNNSRFSLRDWKEKYRHAEHRVGRLEAVRTLLPQVAVPLDGGDVAPNPIPRLRHQHLRGRPGVPRGQRLGRTESADPAADHDAVYREPPGRRLSAGVPDSGIAGDGASDTPSGSLDPARLPRCRGPSAEEQGGDGGSGGHQKSSKGR